MKLLRIYSTFVLCLFLSLISGCTKSSQTLEVALRAEIVTTDPQKSYDYSSNFATAQLYDTVLTYQYLKRPYTLEPLLATSMPEIIQNNTGLRIKLKKDIQYHLHPLLRKNRSVLAKDLLMAFKRVAYAPTEARAWWLIQGIFSDLDLLRTKVKTLKELMDFPTPQLKVIDDQTIELFPSKKSSLNQLNYLLAMYFLAPIPEELVIGLNNKLDRGEGGTGAYELEKEISSKELSFKAISNYKTVNYPEQADRYSYELKHLTDANHTLPFIEKIHLQVIQEDEKRWKLYQDHRLSFLEIPRDQFTQIIDETSNLKKSFQQDGHQLEQSASLTAWFLEFNMNDPILGKNLNLRMAIAHAIDVDQFLLKIFNNADQKANSLFVPGINGYLASKEAPNKYNLSLAKSFLVKAGYPNGKKLPTIILDTRRENDWYFAQANFIKDELEKINIKVEIRRNTFEEFIKKAKNNEMQFWQGGWLLDYPDAENILQLYYSKNKSGPNKANYSNPKVDALFETLQTTTDQVQREQLMNQLEVLIVKDYPLVLLYYAKNYYIFPKNLKNFRFNELSMGFLKYLKIN